MDKEQKEGRLTAHRVVIASFLVDLTDVVLNLIVAFLSGSVVMLTQVLEGLSDLAASGILLVGIVRSGRKSDRTHPFGYGREIYFWTLISALITFGITAMLSIYFGWQRVIAPHRIHDIWLVFLILAITVGTNGYAFFLSYKRLLHKRHPRHIIRIFYRSSLVETKTTFILDFMGAIASIVGIFALVIYVATGDQRFDGIGAIVMGIAIAIGSIFLIAGIRDLMVGRSASAEIEVKIRQAALKVDEVSSIVDLKTLHVGSDKLLVNLDVHMKARLTTYQLERLIDKIKKEIRQEVPSVKYLQVELETPRDHTP